MILDKILYNYHNEWYFSARRFVSTNQNWFNWKSKHNLTTNRFCINLGVSTKNRFPKIKYTLRGSKKYFNWRLKKVLRGFWNQLLRRSLCSNVLFQFLISLYLYKNSVNSDNILFFLERSNFSSWLSKDYWFLSLFFWW